MPSGSVIIDSQELRNFVSQLKQANNELTSTSRRLDAHFRRLGKTWRDPAYAKSVARPGILSLWVVLWPNLDKRHASIEAHIEFQKEVDLS